MHPPATEELNCVGSEQLLTCQVSRSESKLSADPGNGDVLDALSTAAATVKVSL